MRINIDNESRVNDVMVNFEHVHGKDKALLLDALVFLSMNVISIRANAHNISKSPLAAAVLTRNATAMMSAIIDATALMDIDRLDLLAAIGGLCKDIGEHGADAHKKQV